MNSFGNGRRGGAARRIRGAVAAIAALGMLVTAAAPAAAAYYPTGSLVSVDIYDRADGTSLPVYTHDGRSYVVGVPGHEYAVRVRNCSGQRVLAVTSVDGVNVISGETASPDQSGYVIDAWSSVEIAGWRKSFDRTAAFYFTDLGDSYAARTGRPQNVGVIGVAVFREKAPPVVYRPREDRLASRDAAGERKWTLADAAPAAPPANAQAPAPAASASGTYDAAPAARQEATAEADRAVGKVLRAAPSSPLGTGHGRSETSYAQSVMFERASAIAAETVTIQYDRRDNLLAMGVIPAPRYAQRAPQAFPAMRFAPDPR